MDRKNLAVIVTGKEGSIIIYQGRVYVGRALKSLLEKNGGYNPRIIADFEKREYGEFALTYEDIQEFFKKLRKMNPHM